MSHQPQLNSDGNASATVALKQARLEHRAEYLSRRVRRLQAWQSCSYIESELNSTVNSLKRTLENASTFREAEALNDVKTLLNDASLEQKLDNLMKWGELRPEIFNCEELRSASASDIAQVLRRYDSSLKQILGLWSSPAVVASNSSAAAPDSNILLPPNMALDVEDRQSLNRTTDSLQSHLDFLRANYDSDATESSSGGESCDEAEKETEESEVKSSGRFRHTQLQQRASWRWWTDRAWLGSRWSWIQFQLADLEYKIRQHIDLHKQLRCRKNLGIYKGLYPLLAPLNRSSAPISNANCPSKPLSDGKDTNEENNGLSKESCARTRPVHWATRRRVIRTSGMFRWNRKTSAQSSVHCGCFPPYSPCVICGGRVDVKEDVDVPSQTKNIRNAILEPTYHPVLSASRSKGVGVERLLQSHWHTPKPPVPNGQWLPLPRTIVTLLPNRGSSPDRFVELSPTAHTSPFKARRGRRLGTILSKRRKPAVTRRKLSTLKRAKFRRAWSRSLESTTTGNGSCLSSAPDDMESEAGKLGGRRATDRQYTFDIDNIVIDPRVAAVSRVEKIQYKEILTPEWRIRELEACHVRVNEANGTNEADEDISEVAFQTRHGIKEAEEKKRFMPILFRDLHSAARRAQLFGHSLSTESNESSPAPVAQITLTTVPSVVSSPVAVVNNENSAASNIAAELSYDPFPDRNFPLTDEEMEVICSVDCALPITICSGDFDPPESV